MPDILKRGKLPEPRVFRATCGYCKTEFTFREDEGRFEYVNGYEERVACDCPVCCWVVFVGIDYNDRRPMSPTARPRYWRKMTHWADTTGGLGW